MKVRSSLGSIVFALWEEIEAVLRDMMVICYGCWMLYCFLTILLTGELHVFEPNRAMLITEIIVSMLITMAGIRWFVKGVRKN